MNNTSQKSLINHMKEHGYTYCGEVTTYARWKGYDEIAHVQGSNFQMEFSGEVAFVPYSWNGIYNRAAFKKD